MNQYQVYFTDGSSIPITATNQTEAEFKAKNTKPGLTISNIIFRG